ncbi:MAG: holin family protein, partial [Desulfovibrionaceae bacterium]|nr:holin family protein [Desulfovibrionaceae bacterium]
MNPLTFLGGIFGKAVDRLAPDKGKILEAQSRINEQEASGAPASALRLWRPFLGWVLTLLFVWEVVVRPVLLHLQPDVSLPPPMLDT